MPREVVLPPSNKNLQIQRPTSQESQKFAAMSKSQRAIYDAEKESVYATGSDTTQTEKQRTPVDAIGPVETESDKKNTTEATMPQIDESSSPKSLRTVGSGSRPEASLSSLETLSKGVSDSMSLIDNSVKHLHGLMTSVARVVPEENEMMPLTQLDRVKVATACAHQIYQLLKVKVDAVKVYADVSGVKKR